MIVPSMNTCELVKEILLDIQLVERKANYLLDACRRTAAKSKDKSYYHLFEYKSNRKNNWLIEIRYSKGNATFKIIVHYLNEHGINAIAISEDHRFFWFTPHFLKRYNERFLKQEHISKLDLLKRFIFVNRAGVADFNENNHDIFCCFTEGIGLGDVETVNYQTDVFHIRTFISNQMVINEQQLFHDKASKYYQLNCVDTIRRTGIKSI